MAQRCWTLCTLLLLLLRSAVAQPHCSAADDAWWAAARAAGSFTHFSADSGACAQRGRSVCGIESERK